MMMAEEDDAPPPTMRPPPPGPLVPVRAVMLGQYGVGKTSLARCLKDPPAFSPTERTTIGVDFFLETFEDAGVKFALWDTAGQERFRAITAAYYRQADVFVIVFSVRDRGSLAAAAAHLTETGEHFPSIPAVLVGNMADEDEEGEDEEDEEGEEKEEEKKEEEKEWLRPESRQRVISRREARQFAGELPYYETSASVHPDQVLAMFKAVAVVGREVVEPSVTRQRDDGLRTPPPPFSLEQHNKHPSYCCVSSHNPPPPGSFICNHNKYV